MADVVVGFGARDEGLEAAFKRASAGAKGLSDTFSKMAGLAVGAAAIAAPIALAAVEFKKLADYAGGITDLAAQTGLTAEATMIWGQALKNAGLGAEALGPLVNKLQKALSGVNEDGQATNGAFTKLGLNFDKLRGMKPDQQLQAVGDALKDIPSPTDRAALAMEIFGKSGGKALAVFTDSGAIETAKMQLGLLATTLGANIESLDKLSDAIDSAGSNKSMQLMAGFAAAYAGDMERAADAINGIDLSALGLGMGDISKKGYTFVESILKIANLKPENFLWLSPLATAIAAISDHGENIADDMAAKKKRVESTGRNPGQRGESGLENVQAVEEVTRSTLDLTSEIKAAWNETAGLTDEVDLSLGGVTDSLETSKSLSDIIATGAEKEAEARERSAKAAAEITAEGNKQMLQTQLKGAKDQLAQNDAALETIRNYDPGPDGANRRASEVSRKPKYKGIGEKASRSHAAEMADIYADAAKEAADFGDTEKAGKMREKEKKSREKALGAKGPKEDSLNATVTRIEGVLKKLNEKLPLAAIN